MAYTAIPITSVPKSTAGALQSLTWTASDTSNGNQFSLQDGDVVLARNVHASNSYPVTVKSVTDPFGRTGDLTQTIGPGSYAALAQFRRVGWAQAAGALYIEASSANIELAPLRLP